MLTHSQTRGAEEAGVGDSCPSFGDVQATLGHILHSQPFRTSKQCKDLLRYVVDHSLTGDDTLLRERVIGAAVFGRKPSYDTNDDPVVRMRAADVRKRLAQFYQSLEPGTHVLHFELPPGSYRVHFRRDPSHTQELIGVQHTPSPEVERIPLPSQPMILLPQQQSALRRRYVAMFASLLILIGAIAWFRSTRTSPQERFWAPLTANKQPVLLYLGANIAYVFDAEFLAKYRAAHGIVNTGPEITVDLPPGSLIPAADILPIKDTFITGADAVAAVQLTTQLRDWKKPFVLRSGSDLAMVELRDRPSVMIGAFNNPWTLELTNDLPFSFREGVRIQERSGAHRSWSVPPSARESKTDDYALVTRLLRSKTGGPTLIVAGIGQYGTQATAELLTNPDKLHDVLKNAPADWENKNMQAVLHVTVIGYQPVSVETLATAYW